MNTPNTVLPTVPKKRRRIMKRWWFWVIVVVAVLVSIGVVSAILNSDNAGVESYSYLNESVTVERKDLSRIISSNGTLVADYSSALVSVVGGTVNEVAVDVGDGVKKNDVLVRLTSEQVKAPFDGRVIAVHTDDGATVVPGTPVVEVASVGSHVELFASEQEVLDLKKGQPATMTFPAYRSGRDVFTGSVSVVDAQKQSAALQGQTTDSGYRVEVSVTDLPEVLSSRLGLTVDVEVTTAEVSQALAIENGALQYEDDGSVFVYELPTVDDAFVARAQATSDIATLLTKRPVTVGFEGDQYSEIVSGLTDGENVLLYIPQRAGLVTGF